MRLSAAGAAAGTGIRCNVPPPSGRVRGSLATLEKMVQIFPEDIGLKNEMGVAHLLLGDNKGAGRVFGEVGARARVHRLRRCPALVSDWSSVCLQVLAVAPSNGFAKVHYGFILKSENKIAESIPYLKVLHGSIARRM